MEEYTIDAKGRPLGRLATEIAQILQGKHKADFAPHKPGEDRVLVKNIDRVKLTGKKKEQKVYYRHSGRPGRLRKETYADLFERAPEEVLIHAVKGMLPRNKLRDLRLKRLTIETVEK